MEKDFLFLFVNTFGCSTVSCNRVPQRGRIRGVITRLEVKKRENKKYIRKERDDIERKTRTTNTFVKKDNREEDREDKYI